MKKLLTSADFGIKKIFSFFWVLSLFSSLCFCQNDTIVILHLNDTHNSLNTIGPRTSSLNGTLGGIARAASVVGLTKMSEPNVLFLHAGDSFMGDLFFNTYFGVAEFQLLASLGLDAMAVGNHEFDLTPAVLMQSLDSSFTNASFPLLSANLFLDDITVQPLKKYIQAYTIKQMGKTRVGIFGLTTPEANFTSQPAPAFIDTNIIQTAAAYIDTLKTKKCDVIICLSHLGLNLDQMLASYVPGINVIVSGHDHYLLKTPLTVKNSENQNTYIVQTDGFYLNIGKMKLSVQNGKVSLLEYNMIPIDSNIPEEPAISAVVSELKNGIEQVYGPLFSKKITYASDYFEEISKELTSDGYKDTPIGTLIADALIKSTKTDISIIVNGSTSNPFYKGPITGEDIFRVFGYGFNTINGLGYRVATFNMSGMALMSGLEFGLSNIEQNDEYLIQTGGLKYSFNPKNAPLSRLTSVEMNGQPIDPEKIYSVTANEFVPMFLQQLGIPFDNLKIKDTTEFEVLMSYLSHFDTISPVIRSKIISPVKGNNIIPGKIELYQNYPNPFNPVTVISFQLPVNSDVALKVYDITGKEIETLVCDNLNAGNYRINWNAKNLSSGVYIYRLCAGNTNISKKLVLMK